MVKTKKKVFCGNVLFILSHNRQKHFGEAKQFCSNHEFVSFREDAQILVGFNLKNFFGLDVYV